jgi:hypothetical protein
MLIMFYFTLLLLLFCWFIFAALGNRLVCLPAERDVMNSFPLQATPPLYFQIFYDQ